MSNEFQVERAKLQSELTTLAMVGADTNRVRDKLAKLDEREQATRDAEAAAIDTARQDRLLDAAAAAERRCGEIVERLTAAGHELTDGDRQKLAGACGKSAELFVEVGMVRDARSVAAQKISQIAERIGLLEDRRAAIADLRSADQSTDRDLLELRGIELDLETLRAAKADALARLDAIVEPASAVELRQRVEGEIAALERDVVVRSISASIATQEAELLESIKRLVEITGAKTPGSVYRRTPEWDWFCRTGALK
ncbi:hypothetical protein [Bradyrhizobium sp. Leo170]|uniref:hypothetical protein n=1 Tax=Bradyrhizobium sp. Leo170 TaxID=1571199 RepID=UPI00102EB46F|nr:hypothetical protein [Bradyrhizobium sp. Leo170]TAI60430.1 hypothetical protein CWO89_40685 [Bradyrhizobium sp. Leo170]